MTQLIAPDPQDILDRIEEMQDMLSSLIGDSQSLQTIAETAALEFESEAGITQDTCAAMVAVLNSMTKQNYKYVDKFGTTKGRFIYFLPEGMNEGGNTPCNC